MDVRDLQFEDESFDVVIDKGKYLILNRYSTEALSTHLQVQWMP